MVLLVNARVVTYVFDVLVELDVVKEALTVLHP